MTFTRHTVRVGKSLFRPRPSCRPFRAKRVALVLVPEETAWWDIEEWEYDQDYRDWNKGPGITSAFWKNNVNAAFIGYRPVAKRAGYLEVCIYTNDERAAWETSKPLLLRARDAAILTVDLTEPDTLHCTLSAGDQVVEGKFSWRKPWYNRYRWSGLSIGGADNSPGPFGGKAHRYMDLSVAYEKLA